MAVASSPNPKASGSAPTKEKKRKMLDSSVEVDGTKSDKKAIVSGSQPKKRNSNPGVRVINGRVYDSENGTTCHQCRQKTYAVFVTCKNKAKAKPCPIKYCNTCLLNRYGEKVEEVTLLDEWNCPRCRGACNCSICRKKRGHEPTGMLTQMAKAGGFSSVSNMLDVKGDQIVSNYKRVKETCASPRKKFVSEEGIVITSLKKKGKENLFDGKSDSNANPSVPVSSPVDVKPKKSNQKKLKTEESKETISENGKNDEIKPKKSNQKKLKTDLSNDMVVENGNNDAIKPKKTSQKKLKTEGLKETTVGNANEIKPKKVNQKKLKPEGSKETIVENGKNDAIKPKKIIQKKLKLQVSNEIGVENAVLKVNGGQKKQKGTKKTDENKVEDKNTSDENKDQNALKLSTKSSDIVTPLPTGSELLTIGGVDLPKEDVGNALQFLEFCATFGKILDVKKGHAEAVLRDLIKVRSTRRGKCSVAIQFHMLLLSVIQSESESESESELESVLTHRKDSWLKGLKSCIPKSYLSEKIDLIDGKSGGYDCLDSSTKLRLLTFLCDEVLETEKIRNWIDDQNAKFNEKKKEARSKLSDAREKEKSLKQKMQDDIAKAIIDRDGAPLTLMEHDAIISKIKKQTAEAHAEMLACKQMLPIDQERPDAVRIEPVFKDNDGHFYWRLKGCTDKPGILLQDIGNGDLDLSADKWSYYNDEEMDLIEKHIRVMRSRMVQKRL